MPSVKGPFTDSTEAAQTDATFVATNLSPERLQASFSYRRTDAARFAGLDAALRLALNSGLQEKLDQQAINGSDGLLNGTNLDNNNVNAVSTFALYLSGLLYGRVDGRYARTPGDVRMIVGQGTFTHASSAYKGNNSDESGVERLQEKSGGLMVSAHVPSVASNKQNALIRLGSERGAAIQPMWEGVSIVVGRIHPKRIRGDRRSRHPAVELRRHAQDAVVEAADAARLRPWRKPSSTLSPSNCAKPTTGRCCAAWCYRRGALHRAGGAEVFAPLSVVWPSDGIALLGEHRGPELARAVPTREANGALRIETPATPAILAAFATRKFFSVEFHAISEVRTKAGVREITRALVDAAAMVSSPEYSQATAEVRSTQRRVWL